MTIYQNQYQYFCIAAKRQKGISMNFMNNYNSNPIIIGIDHGYGNILCKGIYNPDIY